MIKFFFNVDDSINKHVILVLQDLLEVHRAKINKNCLQLWIWSMITKADKATISLFQKTGTVAQSSTEAQNEYGDPLNIGENLEKLHIFSKVLWTMAK